MSNVNCSIDPISAYVDENVLYDMDGKHNNSYVPCEIIAFSSYKGHAPTFQIVINKSSIFSYVPPHLLFTQKDTKTKLELCHLVYHNCPDYEFSVNKIDYLLDKNINVLIKNLNVWITGKYLWTVDWYQGNDLLNAIHLSNGQICFMPFHKISLTAVDDLPKYKKLHREWSIHHE